MRSEVLAALKSPDPDVRRAAVAVLNEANDIESHDAVVELLKDCDQEVRAEVMEYLEQFPTRADAPMLFENLAAGAHLFLASSALRNLFGESGPLLDEDDSLEEVSKAVGIWREVLRAQGFAV